MGLLVALGLASSAAANVLGKDDRVTLEAKRETPGPTLDVGYTRLIGQVRYGRGNVTEEVCTGALVGWRLVLTTNHCQRTDGNYVTSFRPHVVKGVSPQGAKDLKVIDVITGGSIAKTLSSAGGDWAILVLESEPYFGPDRNQGFGYFPVIEARKPKGVEVTMAGYSKDKFGKTGGVHYGCKIVEENGNGVVDHDCDMTEGASGGPLLVYHEGKWKLTGMAVAEGEDLKDYNVAISAANFIDKIAELRTKYDK